jgi:hypothetical protein
MYTQDGKLYSSYEGKRQGAREEGNRDRGNPEIRRIS